MRSAGTSPSASASSAPAGLDGCNCTTETMRYFTDHGLAHRMAAAARAAQPPHRRRALAIGDRTAQLPATVAEAARARAAVSRREGVLRRAWPRAHRCHARLDRRAGVHADPRARARLVPRLAWHR